MHTKPFLNPRFRAAARRRVPPLAALTSDPLSPAELSMLESLERAVLHDGTQSLSTRERELLLTLRVRLWAEHAQTA